MIMERNFIIIGIIWSVLLAGFLLYAAYPHLVGEEIQLRLAPVDPTDILRGEYMTIRYEITTINFALPSDGTLQTGDRVYVSLSDDEVSTATGYYHAPPEGLYISGTVDDGRIIYGIERFYIPEQSGQRIGTGTYTARIKVKNGEARIIALLKDGEEMEFSYHQNS